MRCPALLRPLPNLKTNPMTPMLKYIPKTQWQLDREREYRDQRRFLWLALVAISTTVGAIVAAREVGELRTDRTVVLEHRVRPGLVLT